MINTLNLIFFSSQRLISYENMVCVPLREKNEREGQKVKIAHLLFIKDTSFCKLLVSQKCHQPEQRK